MSLSRTGSQAELLRGPLCYVLVMIVSTALFWRTSIIGCVMLAMMCGGDGLADIVGRKLGANNRLPYNSNKSVAGSIAMMVGGAGLALSLIALFHALAYLSLGPRAALPPVLAAALASTVVESLPINQWVDDNFSVPFISGLTCWVVMRGLLA